MHVLYFTFAHMQNNKKCNKISSLIEIMLTFNKFIDTTTNTCVHFVLLVLNRGNGQTYL